MARIASNTGPSFLHPCLSRAAALERALQEGSGAFLQDVIGSEGGSLPVRCALLLLVMLLLPPLLMLLLCAP